MENTEIEVKTAKDILWRTIADWRIEHSNPYDMHTNEKVYWTMGDLLRILEEDNVSDKTVNLCGEIFNRFKHYY